LGDIARIHAESSGTYGSPRVHAVAAPGLIHRSDRGIQCAAETYRQALAGSGITPSMSRKADCWDNAPMESFFHTLKIERVHHRVYPTRNQARRDLFQYSKGFHNPPVEHWHQLRRFLTDRFGQHARHEGVEGNTLAGGYDFQLFVQAARRALPPLPQSGRAWNIASQLAGCVLPFSDGVLHIRQRRLAGFAVAHATRQGWYRR
jgi:hypothetical protein